jgi:hypothetical protein
MPDDPPGPPPKYDDALAALTGVGSYVNNADTKIGVLVGALVLLTAAVVHHRPRVAALIHAGPGARGGTALVLFWICCATLVVAGWHLFWAVRPRLTNGEPSRFAFPHLATADLGRLTAHDPVAIRGEAWIQAQTLSKIVLDKYRGFRSALTFSTIAFVAYLGWQLVVP